MNCPICKKTLDPGEQDRPGSSHPFCGPRCKLIDLGRWLGGQYQIPVDEPDDGDAQIETTPDVADK